MSSKTKGPKQITITVQGDTLLAVKDIARRARTTTQVVVNVIVAMELRRLGHVKN